MHDLAGVLGAARHADLARAEAGERHLDLPDALVLLQDADELSDLVLAHALSLS